MAFWKDLLNATSFAANESIKADRIQKSQEFEEQKEHERESLQNCSDSFILEIFHSRYALECGHGFIPINFSTNINHSQSPLFCACTEIFTERDFRRKTVECPFCGNTIGYRWHIKRNDTEYTLSQLGHDIGGRYSNARWNCSCGKYGYWTMTQTENGHVCLELLT